MHADIEELQGMVAELLVYARLERPAEESVKLETVDTLDWLKEALALVAFQAEARNVQCHIQEGYPDHIDLHPRYMSRAAEPGAERRALCRRARARLGHGLPEGGFQLIVDDDGPGIPAAERENIFEPFIRLDDSRDRGTGGAGLGLAIVKRVAASHNGSIEACASPLGGARFVAPAGRDKGTLAPALAAQDADSRRADGCGSADASPSTSTTWPPPGRRDGALQVGGLVLHGAGRGGASHQRGVLLRDLVHLRHRAVDLLDAVGLLGRGGGDLAHDVGYALLPRPRCPAWWRRRAARCPNPGRSCRRCPRSGP